MTADAIAPTANALLQAGTKAQLILWFQGLLLLLLLLLQRLLLLLLLLRILLQILILLLQLLLLLLLLLRRLLLLLRFLGPGFSGCTGLLQPEL